MARKSISSNLKKISSMGSRTEFGVLRIVSITFFILTLFFSLLYFVSAATADVAGGGTGITVDGGLYLNTGVISGSVFLLLIMEFYPTLSDLMKFVRLALIIVLLVFVFMSLQDIYDLADSASGQGEDAMVYVLSSLTVGFAAVAGLLNALEIIRHSGY